jgi:hypothetical protein
MSWQLVSFLILAAVLLGGFAWYERSRPPAQVVALVAVLAALAIAGRIAFAAFPNVKPTTDIIIVAGYALGPAAGFAVGALAPRISHLWFGQGPWTPWQMFAWGLCGILGAGLARVTRDVGRLTLALVCGLAAVAYGTILNFSLMPSYGIEPSWAYFWLLEGRAIPFEIADAAGNIAFALVAGPAMIRMLIRFRERFEWRWSEAAAGAGGGPAGPAPLLLGAFASARAEAATGGPEAAVAWLRAAQNPDGGYGESPGAESGQSMTGWAMLGFEAAGVNAAEVVSGKGRSPVDYLQEAISTVQSPGDLARTILALEGAGIEPREFAGRNLVAALLAKRRPDGSYEDWPNSTAYAVLALRSAGIANVADSLGWLRGAQNEDGGWGDVQGSPSNADGTGAVLQALSPSSKAARRAVGYLRQVQQGGGGYRLGGNGALNTQSTAWAVEGLLAAGANPAQLKRGGKSAYDYLEDNQAGDGHYRYSAKSDQTPVWVTGQVLVAVSHQHLPLEAVAMAPRPKVTRKRTPTQTPTPEQAPLPTPETGGAAATPNPTPVFPRKSAHGAKSGGGKNGGRSGKRRQGGGAKTGGVTPSPGRGGGGNGARAGAEAGANPGAGATGESGANPGATGEKTPPAIEGGTGESFSTGEPKEAGAESESGSGGSVLGSIVAGLVVGCLLFGLGFVLYRRLRKRGDEDGTPPSDPTPPGATPTGATSPGTPPPPAPTGTPPPASPTASGSSPPAAPEPPSPPRTYGGALKPPS